VPIIHTPQQDINMSYNLVNVVKALHTMPYWHQFGILRQPVGQRYVDVTTADASKTGFGLRVLLDDDDLPRDTHVCTLTDYFNQTLDGEYTGVPQTNTLADPTPLDIFDPAAPTAPVQSNPLQFFTDVSVCISVIGLRMFPVCGFFYEGDDPTGLVAFSGTVGAMQLTTEQPPGDLWRIAREDQKVVLGTMKALWTRSGLKARQKHVLSPVLKDHDGGKFFCCKLAGEHDNHVTLQVPLLKDDPYSTYQTQMDEVYRAMTTGTEHGSIERNRLRSMMTAAKATMSVTGSETSVFETTPRSIRVAHYAHTESAIDLSLSIEVPYFTKPGEGFEGFKTNVNAKLVIAALSSLGAKAEATGLMCRLDSNPIIGFKIGTRYSIAMGLQTR
jgi:hypothetical protein